MTARDVFVKRTSYPAELEAEGLRALAEAGARVPAVVEVAGGRLVLERVEGPTDWAAVGAMLAGVHEHTADAFGWHRDNVVGPLPQANGWLADWGEFYAERRIRPHLDALALPVDLRRRLGAALEGPLQALLSAHRPAPSLVHGDLWSGNVVAGRLIDPAVHHADRELDLAFAEVFGGFPEPFWRAYQEVRPLPDGWRERRPALQLYHLLVHVRLFGAGYAPAVAARLDALHW